MVITKNVATFHFPLQHGGSQSHVPPLLISSVSGSELADLFTKQDDSSEDE